MNVCGDQGVVTFSGVGYWSWNVVITSLSVEISVDGEVFVVSSCFPSHNAQVARTCAGSVQVY